jgi:hypothetical protein
MEPRKEIAIGGQAVIEGVMMRGPQYIATAVRRADDTNEIVREPYVSRTKTNRFLRPAHCARVRLAHRDDDSRLQDAQLLGQALGMDQEDVKKKSAGREKFEETMELHCGLCSGHRAVLLSAVAAGGLHSARRLPCTSTW